MKNILFWGGLCLLAIFTFCVISQGVANGVLADYKSLICAVYVLGGCIFAVAYFTLTMARRGDYRFWGIPVLLIGFHLAISTGICQNSLLRVLTICFLLAVVIRSVVGCIKGK